MESMAVTFLHITISPKSISLAAAVYLKIFFFKIRSFSRFFTMKTSTNTSNTRKMHSCVLAVVIKSFRNSRIKQQPFQSVHGLCLAPIVLFLLVLTDQCLKYLQVLYLGNFWPKVPTTPQTESFLILHPAINSLDNIFLLKRYSCSQPTHTGTGRFCTGKYRHSALILASFSLVSVPHNAAWKNGPVGVSPLHNQSVSPVMRQSHKFMKKALLKLHKGGGGTNRTLTRSISFPSHGT